MWGAGRPCCKRFCNDEEAGLRHLCLWVACLGISGTLWAQDKGSHSIDAVLTGEIAILDALDGAVFEARRAEAEMQRALEVQKACEARLAVLKEALEAAENKVREAKARLELALKLIAGAGTLDPLSILLRGEEAEQDVRRSVLLRRLAAQKAKEWRAYEEALSALRVVEFQTAMERANAYAAKEAAREAKKRLEESIESRRKVLEALERDRNASMRLSRELTAAQREMVATIVSRLSQGSGLADIEKLRGRMRSPLAGARVVAPFGDIVHPRFKTKTPHPGMTLAFEGREERNVRAVAFGKVVFVGPMRGYGLTVVLDHTQGYYTVYAGLAKSDVGEGKVVREGDVLGQVRRLPGEKEVRLYFEIRKGEEALDPAHFIAKEALAR